MEQEKKKKKSGVDYLREKVAKLQKENAEQKATILSLNGQLHDRDGEIKKNHEFMKQRAEQNAQLLKENEQYAGMATHQSKEIARLKLAHGEKIEQLISEREKTAELQKKVAKLNADLVSAEERLKSALIENESYAGQLLEHMGWFKRWTWKIKHGGI